EIEKFQEFWSMLDDIDQNTWILEPDKPKRNDLIRRIALADYEIECGICYTYHLESSIPEYSCNNSKCGRLFHQICLSESITIQNKKL
ncbi:4442_t:CDS:2, partial [Entrophospora sp. SA101]